MSTGPARRVRIPEATWSDLLTLSSLTGESLPDLLRSALAHGVRQRLKRQLKQRVGSRPMPPAPSR